MVHYIYIYIYIYILLLLSLPTAPPLTIRTCLEQIERQTVNTKEEMIGAENWGDRLSIQRRR